ncbi:MAG: metalloregulator ArsR/SmtB family transcription factor [Bdellovibrionales bacterium]|nr:metalloregulator ArsR/SmtB family transcription factor [Bdellovibrionales bacterium]
MHLLKTQPETIFQALSDPLRIRVIRLLTTTDEEACLCELVDSLLEPEYKLSRHIKILKSSGLLTARKDGRWVYHRLVNGVPYLESLYETINLLSDADGFFRKDLSNFKKRMRIREDGRCQVGIISSDLSEKAK